MQSLCILGRQPALGLAELESLYGAGVLQPIGGNAALVDIVPEKIDFARLGGTIKLAKFLTIIPTTDWRRLEAYLIEHIPKHACCIAPGKLTLGLSAYGLSPKPAAMSATALKIKKAVRVSGRPVRIVPGTESALSSAQVLHNRLFTSHNWELLLVGDGNQTYLAQTVAVQDITAYAARDQARPRRDARMGMLPPKLAQIIINLAAGQVAVASSKRRAISVLDPFCGTGVILQEALLMGYGVCGTDREPRLIEYSQANLDWLASRYNIQSSYILETGDATTYTWQKTIDAVASETYLGRAFTAQPGAEIFAQTIRECDLIIKKFLSNIHSQIAPGTHLCLAVPAWQTQPGRFQHLPLIDSLEQLGYNRVSFVHASNNDLIYYREDQIVGRELLVLTRK